MNPRTLAIMTLRNEAAFILDWLAHHIAVGISDFLVLSNDCQDGTGAMLDRLEALGRLTHLRNPPPYGARGVQFSALNRAAAHCAAARAEWIVTLDIDEFINIHCGGHRMADLFAAIPQAGAIALTWRLFGNAGVEHFRDVPVPDQFTACAPRELHWPWRAHHFKTLYRNDGHYARPGVHRPRGWSGQAVRWCDGSGQTMPLRFAGRGLFTAPGRAPQEIVQLNHYPLGAMESFVLKSDRGRAVHGAERLGLDYWCERNFSCQTDDSIAALAPQVAAIRADLGTDPVLATLHEAAVAWRRARFAELMQQDHMRTLMGNLLMSRPACALPKSTAARLFAHARSSAPGN